MVLAPDDTHLSDFDEFYRVRFQGPTLQLYAYIGDLAEAQDLVQEAFCRAFVQPRMRLIGGRRSPGRRRHAAVAPDSAVGQSIR